ncbi:MAG: fumarylacetoacetase, partial [Gemmatimonadota bacterium]|nr:fumarylacetoacetase [Gemmatimonadota bacterium]
MIRPVDDTHRADLVSWVESAQTEDTDFPIQNLPLGVFRDGRRLGLPGIAIGDQILDLAALGDLLDETNTTLVARCVQSESLTPILASGSEALTRLRGAVSRLLRADTPEGARARPHANALLVNAATAELLVPARIGDYTDFYASVHHATNVGSMFRPDNPLLPNYKWVPIGYHGRASSVVASGHVVRRPTGQTRDESAAEPTVGPTRRLDYELEVGAFIAAGNPLGRPISLRDAEAHVAGLCLVNDWSARDIQSWEYQPLGPFLSKSFATSVSPWIVTLDALAPFRAPAFARADGDPRPLPYLYDDDNEHAGGVAITLEVLISTSRMRAKGDAPMRVSLGSFTTMYWTMAQLVTHHTSNGCNLQPGDLIASGTVSGSTPESRGC